MIKVIYSKDVDISKFPLPEGNVWREALGRRNLFYSADSTTTLPTNFFNVFNVNGKVIINRKYGIKMPSSELVDGVYYWDFPIDPSRDEEVKNNTNPMVSETHLLFDYYCKFDEGLDLEVKKKFYTLAKRAVVNVLERVSDNISYSEEGEGHHNDILINGRKVWGEERTQLNNGVYSIGNTILNFSEHFDFYNPNLKKEIETGKASGKGMTGVEDEIPGYTRDQFIKDYLNEIDVLTKELKKYL